MGLGSTMLDLIWVSNKLYVALSSDLKEVVLKVREDYENNSLE